MRLFGTDGVRGLANVELTPALALALGEAAGRVLGRAAPGRPRAVVARDGRASGEMLGAALVAGLLAAGVDVDDAGVLPTPAVAFLAADGGASLGAVLSASHNPMADNGVKLFGAAGEKLPDDVEDEVERVARALLTGSDASRRPSGRAVGRLRPAPEAAERYLSHLQRACPQRLDGLHVVVDCAHGAASAVAPSLYARLGAAVTVVGAEPDGWNINDGVGSTHLEHLARTVREVGADAGVAHDGDADRCLAVTADGAEVDGDQILAVCALALDAAGALPGRAVVTTVMTNLGFHHAMEAAGLSVVQTPVGDRHVLAALHERGLVLGGEQSGHLVLLRHATTGDGLLTAAHLLGQVARTGRPLSELVAVVRRLPQVLVNVRADRALARHEDVVAAARDAQAELGASGRVLLRPSGTEPLVRVMVEAPTSGEAERHAEAVAAVVRARAEESVPAPG